MPAAGLPGRRQFKDLFLIDLALFEKCQNAQTADLFLLCISPFIKQGLRKRVRFFVSFPMGQSLP
jgi:hypothetical protein